MTKGGPQETTHTIVYHVFVNGFRYYDMGYATAISFALVVFVGPVEMAAGVRVGC